MNIPEMINEIDKFEARANLPMNSSDYVSRKMVISFLHDTLKYELVKAYESVNCKRSTALKIRVLRELFKQDIQETPAEGQVPA